MTVSAVIANSAAPLGIVLIDPATGLPYVATGGGGVAISAAGSSLSTGTLVFSNSNGVTFGIANGVLTATVTPGAAAGIAAVQLPNTTYTSGTVNFINSNGLSFGSTTGGGVTGSYSVPGATVFSNSNNVSFGLAGSTVTATATLPIGLAGGAAGTQTQTSGTLVFVNSNGLSFGMSNSSQVTGSYSVPAATVFSNSNNVSFGLAGSTVTATATFAGGGAAISAAGSSQNVGTIVFSNSNGVSFGMAGSTITATVTPGAAAGVAAAAAGTQTQTSGTLVFSNSNGVSFGLSGSSQLTASVAAQSNQSLGIYASSQTTGQSSSSTFDARSLSVVFAGVMSGGMSGGSLLISAPGTTGLTQLSVGMSTGGNTLGTTGLASAQLVLVGTNNITLSGSTNAGSMTISISGGAGAGGAAISAAGSSQSAGTVVFSNSNGVSFGMNGSTVTGSVLAQTNQSIGYYAVGNTTQNSSTTLDARTVSLDGLGALTVGFSNGSVQLSAPATSSLSGTGQVSIAVNGSTISIGAPNYGTLSYWDNGIIQGAAAVTQNGIGSVVLQPISMGANLSMSAVRQFIQGSFSTLLNSSFANTISIQAGLYTLSGSTLSLASSGSQSFSFSNTSNNNLSVLTGIKGLTSPLNAFLTPGNYWIGLWSSTTFGGNNWATVSNVVASEGPLTYNGLMGANTAATNQVVLGGGVWSATSANLPVSIGLSQITGSVGNIAPFVNLYNASA
jgi:hypothetical protein